MKNKLFIWVLALSIMPLAGAFSQNAAAQDGLSYKAEDITVSESLIKFSDLMKFKYMDVLGKAEKGDRNAIKTLVEFHGTTDGKDAINHAVTCLELIPVANDENYAYACKYLKPNLKSLLVDRLAVAQGRTNKTALQKPMKEWAPMTWASLNNLPIPGECNMGDEYQENPDGTRTLRAPKKPGQENQPADQKLKPAGLDSGARPDAGGRQ